MAVSIAARTICPSLLLIALLLSSNGWASGALPRASLDVHPQTDVSQQSTVSSPGAGAEDSAQALRSAAEILLDKIRVSSKRQAAEAAHHLGLAAMERLDLTSAMVYHREAVQLDPANLSYLQAAVGTAYLSDRFDEALGYQLKVLARVRDELGEGDPRVAGMLDRLAAIYAAQHRFVDAEIALKESLAIKEKSLGEDHPAVAVSLNFIASLAVKRERPEEAEALLKRTVQILQAASGPRSPDAAAAIHNLAELYREQQRFTEAKELYDQAVAIWEDSPDEDPLKLAATRYSLGRLYLAQKQIEETRSQFELALKTLQEALGPEHPYVSAVMHSMTSLTEEKKTLAATEDIYRALLNEFESRSLDQ